MDNIYIVVGRFYRILRRLRPPSGELLRGSYIPARSTRCRYTRSLSRGCRNRSTPREKNGREDSPTRCPNSPTDGKHGIADPSTGAVGRWPVGRLHAQGGFVPQVPCRSRTAAAGSGHGSRRGVLLDQGARRGTYFVVGAGALRPSYTSPPPRDVQRNVPSRPWDQADTRGAL